MLAAGINVVTTSIPGLVHPAGYNPKHVDRLEAACREGGASLYASGIEPGFAGDQLVLTLATLSQQDPLGAHAGDLHLRRLSGRVHDVRGVRLREAARAPLHHADPRHPDLVVGAAGADGGRPPRRAARRDPRDLRQARDRPPARGRRGRDRAGHGRRGALRDDRRGRRPRRDRDRAREPDGERHRTRLADRRARRHLPDRLRRRSRHDLRAPDGHARDVRRRRPDRHRDARDQRDPVRVRGRAGPGHLGRPAGRRCRATRSTL